MHEVTPENAKWIGDFIHDEFAIDGDLTWGELMNGIHRFERVHHVMVSKEILDGLKAMFFLADTDGNGIVTKKELDAVDKM